MEDIIQKYKLYLLNQFDLNEAEKMSRIEFMKLVSTCVVSYLNKTDSSRAMPKKQRILNYTRQVLWSFHKNEQETPKQILDTLKQEICPDFSHDIQTSLMVCVQKSTPQVIETLINAGANVNHKDAEGKTPLMYAVGNIHSHTPEIIDLLIKNGADIKAETNKKATVFHCLKSSDNEDETIAVFDKLQMQGADMFAMDEYCYTPLMQMVRRNSLSLVKRVMSRAVHTLPKADRTKILKNYINQKNAFGYDALFYAIVRNQPDMIKVLVENGADLKNKDSRNRTPLMVAIAELNLPAVQTLVECGAKIDEETLNFFQDVKTKTKRDLVRYGRMQYVERYLKNQIKPMQKAIRWFVRPKTREKE